MNILVTGSTGFVGKHLVDRLLENGHFLTCIVRNVAKARGLFGENVNLIKGDLTDFQNPNKEIRNAFEHAEVICHLAACIGSSRVKDFYDLNVTATKFLCQITSQSSKQKKIIYLSSLAVIGDKADTIYESAKCEPFSVYGKTKMLAESVLSGFVSTHTNMQLFILRTPVIYGPQQSDLVLDFFNQIKSGSITVLGNGKNIRAMCYVKNLVDAMTVLIESLDFNNSVEIINIADKEQLSLGELIKLIASKMSSNIQIKHLPQSVSLLARGFFRVMNLFQYNSSKLFVLATASAKIKCSTEKAVKMNIPLKYRLEDGIEETVNSLTVKT